MSRTPTLARKLLIQSKNNNKEKQNYNEKTCVFDSFAARLRFARRGCAAPQLALLRFW